MSACGPSTDASELGTTDDDLGLALEQREQNLDPVAVAAGAQNDRRKTLHRAGGDFHRIAGLHGGRGGNHFAITAGPLLQLIDQPIGDNRRSITQVHHPDGVGGVSDSPVRELDIKTTERIAGKERAGDIPPDPADPFILSQARIKGLQAELLAAIVDEFFLLAGLTMETLPIHVRGKLPSFRCRPAMGQVAPVMGDEMSADPAKMLVLRQLQRSTE